MRQNDPIARVRIYWCRLPVRSVRAHGSGTVARNVDVVLVNLLTTDGVDGWGEAAPWAVFTGTADAAFAALAHHVAPLVLGRDAARLPAIMTDVAHALVGHPEAKAALETALLDIAGRQCGVAVHQLLGGRLRDTIGLSVSLADPSLARDLALLDRLRAEGIGIVKVKTGFAEHRHDLERLEAFRAAGPELDIRVDYNQGLEAHAALRRLRDLDRLGLTFIEQPVPGAHREALAAITRALDTPILADESVFSTGDAFAACAGRICDLVSVKIMKCGGPREGLAVASICEAAGIACYGGDMFETGIAHLAGTHMIAAARNISLGWEFYQARWYLEEDLLEEPFPIENGAVVVPDGPGLGIAVDRQKVERFAIAVHDTAPHG